MCIFFVILLRKLSASHGPLCFSTRI
ncbi:ORFL144C [Human betaherpesvirus 5]|nr:ORFL144C [Human betaherpesvirus 5]QHX40472.1 ORFL144C [Human betaherpesvirus 5]